MAGTDGCLHISEPSYIIHTRVCSVLRHAHRRRLPSGACEWWQSWSEWGHVVSKHRVGVIPSLHLVIFISSPHPCVWQVGPGQCVRGGSVCQCQVVQPVSQLGAWGSDGTRSVWVFPDQSSWVTEPLSSSSRRVSLFWHVAYRRAGRRCRWDVLFTFLLDPLWHLRTYHTHPSIPCWSVVLPCRLVPPVGLAGEQGNVLIPHSYFLARIPIQTSRVAVLPCRQVVTTRREDHPVRRRHARYGASWLLRTRPTL